MNKGIIAFVFFVVIYFGLGIVSSLLANGLFVFNINRNDGGITNLLEIIVILIGILYVILSWRGENNSKTLHHIFFGLLTITFSAPVITYYLYLPSNDYARIAAIIFIPILIIVWIWTTKIINKPLLK